MLEVSLKNEDIAITADDIPEILRYLEYSGQEISDSLKSQIDECILAVNKSVRPKFVLQEFDMKENGDFPDECSFLSGEDIKRHLKNCHKIILFAATLGIELENTIRRASIKNVADSVIMDSCASTLIEVFCDTIDSRLRLKYNDFYLTTRYSPGYGDLPISVQKDFTRLLDTSRKIGINVSDSGIMIPRKSVTAIIGVSKEEIVAEKFNCSKCNNFKACRFLRRGVRCGR